MQSPLLIFFFLYAFVLMWTDEGGCFRFGGIWKVLLSKVEPFEGAGVFVGTATTT